MPGPLLFDDGIGWGTPGAMERWQKACEAERAISAATGTTAMDRALKAIDEAFAPATTMDAMAAAKVAYWKTYPDAGFDSFRMLCPGIVGLPSTKVHARYMRATADIVVENATRAADHRNAAALRLWADEIEAEAQEAA